MAHECPDCWSNCHCGGDIDDCCFGDSEYSLGCAHCAPDMDDDDDDYWDDEALNGHPCERENCDQFAWNEGRFCYEHEHWWRPYLMHYRWIKYDVTRSIKRFFDKFKKHDIDHIPF